MSEIEVEEISKDKESLSRACIVSVGSRKIPTPTRAIAVTRSSTTQLEGAIPVISGDFRPFGEVYAQVSIGFLANLIEHDEEGRKFSGAISHRVSQLRQAGVVPYLVLSLLDNEGNFYPRLPPKNVMTLLFDILWGTEGNEVIVPPLLGILETESEYVKLIDAIEGRRRSAVDRNHRPVMAVVPSAYRLVAPEIVERYWKMGCRFFAFNLENKKLGAYGYIIERLHSELTALSKRDKESYALHALNSRMRMGRGDSMRVNDLLAPGFGFDSFGPSHGGRQRWVPPAGRTTKPTETTYLLDNQTYGFFPVESIASLGRGSRQLVELDTAAFKKIDISSLRDLRSDQLTSACLAHNVEKELREVRSFPELIEEGELTDYFSGKERVIEDVRRMKSFAGLKKGATKPIGLDGWFS